MKKIILLSIVCICCLHSSQAQPGKLDPSFGNNGTVTADLGNNIVLKCAAIQKDKKIVVAGTTFNGLNYDFALVRYNIDGSLDSSFNHNGTQLTDFNSKDDYATSIAIQDDGKIVVSGYCGNNDSSDVKYWSL